MMENIRPNEEINGRYVLKQSKGRGTFGQVWLAYDRATDEDVAIKFYVALDHKGREEFIQEFRIAAQLHHPNLLVTKDYGEWQGHPYLTMKYCDRGSAADLIGTLKPCENDEREIWNFIHDVAAGLAYLHAVGPAPIVHQDIKPDNTLIDTDGTFLITDFGISKRIRNTMRKQSTRALKAGAPAYMGPERFSDNPEPILASDVWSLGASIYELAEGELPFCGMGGIMMSKGAEIPSLSSGWSKNLNDIMRWCLEKDTWNRAKAYQIQEIAEAVLNANQEICVSTLISQMIGKGQTSSSQTTQQTDDPHVTRPHVNNETFFKNNTNNNDAEISNPIKEPVFWWKKPIVWIVSVGIVALIFIVVNVLPQRSTLQKNIEVAIKSDSIVKDSADKNIASIQEEKIPVDKPKGNTLSQPERTQRPIKQSSQGIGTLNLGYATWHGNIIDGKPDGKGTMTFTTAHRIDSRDPNKRMAKEGERIDGSYVNGHLDEGRWYKSDGSTEYIMLGE